MPAPGLRSATNLVDALLDGIDPVAAVRGASTGFSLLVVGGLLTPLGTKVPVVGSIWLTVVAVVAFAVAGMRIGTARRPALHGAMAAVCSYLLVVPLVLLAAASDARQLILTGCVAVGVGALAGAIRARIDRTGER